MAWGAQLGEGTWSAVLVPFRPMLVAPRVTVASLRTNKTIEKPCQAPRDTARRQPAPYLDCETTHHTARRVA
jgi:hypothetical protein